MQNGRSRAVAVLAGVAALAVTRGAGAVSPPNIYDNYQSFPVGSRAAGMGGAYTALACDEGALHYNPASLACASASHLELAANAYMIQGLDVPNAFGTDENVAAITYHSIPSIVGGVRILSEGGADGTGRLAFGLSVSVPRSVALKVDPANPNRRSFLSFSVRDDLTTGDLGLAYQINRWIGIGISGGAALRTYESRLTFLVAQEGFACEFESGPYDDCGGYFMQTDESEILAVGLRGKLGVRITPSKSLSFGLAVTSPTIDVFGSAKVSTAAAVTLVGRDSTGTIPPTPGYFASPFRYEGSSDVGLPMRVAIGGAYSTPGFTLSLDLSLNLPRDASVAYAMEEQRIEGVAPGDPLPDEVLTRGLQPNVNLGAELLVAKDLVLDAGVFTDLSSVSPEDARAGTDRVHMFGGSLALGLLGKQSRGWFGLSAAVGQAESLVSAGRLDLEGVISRGGLGIDGTSTVTRWQLTGTIGSNYSFLPEDDPPPAAAPAASPPSAPPAGAPPPPVVPASAPPP